MSLELFVRDLDQWTIYIDNVLTLNKIALINLHKIAEKNIKFESKLLHIKDKFEVFLKII